MVGNLKTSSLKEPIQLSTAGEKKPYQERRCQAALLVPGTEQGI